MTYHKIRDLGLDYSKHRLARARCKPLRRARSSEFVAVSGAQAETTSATTMLVTAYSLFWLLLLAFVWMTWRRQQSLSDRLRQIESRVATQNDGDPK